MNLGKAIRVMIARASTSQNKLSKAVGVTRSYMSSLCSDTHPAIPSLPLLEEMCHELDCKMSDLIKECE